MMNIDIPLPPKQHDQHDLILDWQDCEICHALMDAAVNDMADAHLGPMGPLALIDWIRATALTKFDAIVRVG